MPKRFAVRRCADEQQCKVATREKRVRAPFEEKCRLLSRKHVISYNLHVWEQSQKSCYLRDYSDSSQLLVTRDCTAATY